MKRLIIIISIILLFSCKKDQDIIDNPSGEIWPTNNWTYINPEDIGLKKAYLDTLNYKIANGDYGNIHSLLIVKNGYLVFEKYYNGSSITDAHELQSATKSIASVICEIAMSQGYFQESSILIDFLGANYTHDNDTLRNQITIKNVLDMRLGIEWKEWGYPYIQKDNIIMANSPDWIQYVLDKPMATIPNSEFLYNTGASVFISALIDINTPYSTKEFSKIFLFNPIGIKSQNWWVQDIKGVVHTGGGLKMTAQDMARFGYLIIKNGKWNTQQIVPNTYLSKIENPINLNVASVPVGSIMQTLHYGYHWWNIPIQDGSIIYNVIAAMGTGGQVIFIIKELNLVVVSTAWNITEPNQTSAPLEWLTKYIIPSTK